jgi:pimeloyl-ACP methyl ester carboxylesterase
MTSFWMRRLARPAAVLALLGTAFAANAQGRRASPATPPDSIPTFSTENLARKGFFYAGGEYAGEPGKEVMAGQMYVEVWVPRRIRQPYPIVMFHGNGQPGNGWQQTPDGRPGWAYYLIDQGYVVYMVEYPARGRSAYVPGVHGELGIRTVAQLESIFTNGSQRGDFPLKANHTQWPGTGLEGDPVFDDYLRSQLQYVSGQDELTLAAGVPLLDKIGQPVILLTHSQGGAMGWLIADRRPSLVKAIVTVEPGGPPMAPADTANVKPGERRANSWGPTNQPLAYDPPVTNPAEDLKVYLEASSERPDEIPCYLQEEPARQLVHLKHIPVLAISANGTYHRVFDACVPKWLRQAGVDAEFVRLEEAGISGNGHMMMLEKNSDDIIAFVHQWLEAKLP